MKNTISFLEEMGRNADLRLDRIDFESILNNEDFDAETREAILNKDHRALELLLNARSKIVCMIQTPEDEEDEEDEEDKEAEEDDSTEDKAGFAGQFKKISQAS